jgi:hypothetical protein
MTRSKSNDFRIYDQNAELRVFKVGKYSLILKSAMLFVALSFFTALAL